MIRNQSLASAQPGRQVGVLLHPSRAEAVQAAAQFASHAAGRGVTCLFEDARVQEVRAHVDVPVGVLTDPVDPDMAKLELVVVFGGDGTILSASDWSVPAGIPLLGVNLGHVGFLAELESSEMTGLAEQVGDRDYEVEERLTLAIEVRDSSGQLVWRSHAINELSLEKGVRQKMIEVKAQIDGRPLSRWGCDGVLVATPTGSTAYAFSAGGPVIWPDVEALLLVPLAAHALFAKAMVLSPSSCVDLELSTDRATAAVVWADGRRTLDLAPGSPVKVTRARRNLLLARLKEQPFTDRLVRKFALPVNGWR